MYSTNQFFLPLRMGDAMPERAGFHFEHVGTDACQLSPLVLLHGSGSSETFLMDFARRIAPERAAFALRGPVPWEGGFAFFRRNADRTLDQNDLIARCTEFCGFLEHLSASGHRRPLMIGYSNGAIIAAATAVRAPELSSGSILLRPLSPFAEGGFPPLHGYPTLLLAGVTDQRRQPSDMPHLAKQFRQAGALVTTHVLPTGHGLEETDQQLSREWLAGRA